MIKAIFYEQKYFTDILRMSICRSKEIFIPEPYNIIIAMGGDSFHKLDQLNLIKKATEAKLSHKAKFSEDEYGNEFDVIVFCAKNVRSIDFPIPLAEKCVAYAEIYEKQKELKKILNNNILDFLLKNQEIIDQAIIGQAIKVTIYDQKYMFDITRTYMTRNAKEIFIHSPYNILIVMGGDNFHDLDQINIIRKASEPNLSIKAITKYDDNGDETNTIFNAKNIRESFMSIELVHKFDDFVSNNQDELKKSLNIDISNFLVEQNFPEMEQNFSKNEKTYMNEQPTSWNYCNII